MWAAVIDKGTKDSLLPFVVKKSEMQKNLPVIEWEAVQYLLNEQ